MGASNVHACPACATEVVPRLQADAIRRTPLPLGDVALALEHQQADFWRAIALRLARERDATAGSRLTHLEAGMSDTSARIGSISAN